MKKLLVYLLIVLFIGGVLGIALQTPQSNVVKKVPVVGSALQILTPVSCYADSDTAGEYIFPPPPPPPPID